MNKKPQTRWTIKDHNGRFLPQYMEKTKQEVLKFLEDQRIIMDIDPDMKKWTVVKVELKEAK